MKEALYKEIKSKIAAREELVGICAKYDVPYHVVRSIYALKVQNKESGSRRRHQDRAQTYLEEYLQLQAADLQASVTASSASASASRTEGAAVHTSTTTTTTTATTIHPATPCEHLVSLSEKYDTQPVMMARYVLDALCARLWGRSNNSSKVSEWVKSPDSLLDLGTGGIASAVKGATGKSEDTNGSASGEVAEVLGSGGEVGAEGDGEGGEDGEVLDPPLSSTTPLPPSSSLSSSSSFSSSSLSTSSLSTTANTLLSIPPLASHAQRHTLSLAHLAAEVRSCIDYDDSMGPLADLLKANVGLEYEAVLAQHLMAAGVRFLPDSTLRAINLSKTPDALLVGGMVACGHVLQWVESKALFGDPDTMASHFSTQLAPYRDRYGGGLVIYWMGFVEEAAAALQRECAGVVVMDHFPEDARGL